jgi:hypothetical protein
MDFSQLKYIKNVNDSDGWAYENQSRYSYFPLTFKRNDGVEAHALKLPKGSLIILSQTSRQGKRYLTHMVELCNNSEEDKLQWSSEQWGIIRWIKVCWVSDFCNVDTMPVDREVMKADWGWFDTKAKSLESPNLMAQWGSLDNLRTHLKTIFI